MDDNYSMKEIEAKLVHDPHYQQAGPGLGTRQVWVPGPVIVGAGPSGLAVAACLKERGIPSLVLERDQCVGSLWQLKTYDRLRLHLPKHLCHLPFYPFPNDFPTYPSRAQFINYLECYTKKFDIRPAFGWAVEEARYESGSGLWRVRAVGRAKEEKMEYVSKWVVVATGENAEAYVPEIEGREKYVGKIIHSIEYKSGNVMRNKKVLVVGCGNSGMELCLDLCNHNAFPSLVVRDSIHVLPQHMLGTSTFGLSMMLIKWLPVKLVDQFLLVMSRLILGNTDELGLPRPTIGPLEYKGLSGKTPVLDVGTLAQIKSGYIKVYPGIKKLTTDGVEFVDGRTENFDIIILATGFKSNVSSWLKGTNMFTKKGYPIKQFPNGWKGDKGLYAVGFTRRGLLGSSLDAISIAQDIDLDWKIYKSKAS